MSIFCALWILNLLFAPVLLTILIYMALVNEVKENSNNERQFLFLNDDINIANHRPDIDFSLYCVETFVQNKIMF